MYARFSVHPLSSYTQFLIIRITVAYHLRQKLNSFSTIEKYLDPDILEKAGSNYDEDNHQGDEEDILLEENSTSKSYFLVQSTTKKKMKSLNSSDGKMKLPPRKRLLLRDDT